MADIDPSDCPEPFWHETHNYCPVCTWQRDMPPSRDALLAALLDTLSEADLRTAAMVLWSVARDDDVSTKAAAEHSERAFRLTAAADALRALEAEQ